MSCATGSTTAPGSSRASAATRPTKGPAVFRHREHLERLQASAELYYLPLEHPVDELRDATHELIRRNGLQQLLHPPARVPRLRRDGALREELAGRRDRRGLAVGRLSRRRGQAERHPRQGLVLAAHLAARPDPAGEGLGPVPELDPRQDRVGTTPATTRRSCSTRPAMSARARARTSSSSATASSSRRRTRLRSSTGSAASRSSRSPATSATRGRARRSPAPSSTSPRRCSSAGTAAELVPVREIDDHELGSPGEITRRSRRSSRTPCTGAPRSTRSGLTWSNCRVRWSES